MKKITAIIFTVIITISILTACHPDNKIKNNEKPQATELTRDEQVATFIKEQFPAVDSVYLIGKLEEYKNIVDIYSSCEDYFITDAGELYLMGHFSDGSSIRKIDTDVRAKEFYNGCVVDEHNNLYYYDESSGELIRRPASDEDYLGESFVSNSIDRDLSCYVQIKDNKLFSTIYFSRNIIESSLIYTFDDDETIEYIIDGSIKTNKRFYRIDVVANISEYDDIETTYSCVVHPVDITIDGIRFIKYENNDVISVVDNEGKLYRGFIIDPFRGENATKIEL